MDAATRQRLAQITDFVHGGALERFIDGLINVRDTEWSHALGAPRVMTPKEAVEWLQKDRVERARNVSEARVRRGPVHW